MAAVESRSGVRTRAEEQLGSVRHIFTHRALTLEVVRLKPVSGRLRSDSSGRWCTPREVADLPLSALMKKTLRLVDLMQ